MCRISCSDLFGLDWVISCLGLFRTEQFSPWDIHRYCLFQVPNKIIFVCFNNTFLFHLFDFKLPAADLFSSPKTSLQVGCLGNLFTFCFPDIFASWWWVQFLRRKYAIIFSRCSINLPTSRIHEDNEFW